jgi:hypothetical protein
MQSTSFKSLVQKGLVKTISTLRLNSNGYPFITLLNKQNRAANLYFGKNSSQSVLDTFGEGANVIELLKHAQVVMTENANGEVRYKISTSGNYESEASIADAFGVEVESDFDFAEFAKQFENETVSA